MTRPLLPPIPSSHLGRQSEPERKFRLIEQVRARMRASRYSRRTEQAYVDWIRRYVLYHERKHPQNGEAEVSAFLTHLAVAKNVIASTQNQALHALVFLYRHILRKPLVVAGDIVTARRGRRLPVVLSAQARRPSKTRPANDRLVRSLRSIFSPSTM